MAKKKKTNKQKKKPQRLTKHLKLSSTQDNKKILERGGPLHYISLEQAQCPVQRCGSINIH